jgi:hypothetical protein
LDNALLCQLLWILALPHISVDSPFASPATLLPYIQDATSEMPTPHPAQSPSAEALGESSDGETLSLKQFHAIACFIISAILL